MHMVPATMCLPIAGSIGPWANSTQSGLDRLMFVHANDSKGQLGAARDRHEHIGEGLIGVAGFRAILRRKELRDLPFILETPVNSPDDQVRDLAALRAAAGEGY